MRRAITSCLVFLSLLVPALAFAQYPPRTPPSQPPQSLQVKTVTGTITRFSDVKIQVAMRRRNVRQVNSFLIDKKTVIEGNLAVGKTVRVEYTRRVIYRRGKDVKRRTAVKITVLP